MSELSEDGKKLLKDRYCRDTENYSDVFPRVAHALGKKEDLEKEFLEIMETKKFLPNSPTLRNAGFSNFMSACFVLPIKDDMVSIFDALRNMAIIQKEGGGTGFNFSEIREKGAPLSSGGTASGALSFMKIFDAITDAVKQGGFRRGANMGILYPDHPEILDFIKAKVVPRTFTNFNFSVMVNDDFMKGIEKGETLYLRSRKDKRIIKGKIKMTDLFSVITYSAWISADPGLLFYDRINRDNIYREPIEACNPCGEQPLLPFENCCLGSINLNELVEKNEFNWDEFKRITEIGTKFLLAIKKYEEFPIDELYKMNWKTNRIGLGIMGFSDALIKMHIKYDSDDALRFIDKLGKCMKPVAKQNAPNSASVLSIAPTGSLSILASCSAGIEPPFAQSYERRVVAGTFKEKREDSEYLRTAMEISPEWHLKVQAHFQQFVDSGVSKTVNLPEEATIQDIRDIYYKAWKMGAKGVTVYRNRSKEEQVMYEGPTCEDGICYL